MSRLRLSYRGRHNCERRLTVAGRPKSMVAVEGSERRHVARLRDLTARFKHPNARRLRRSHRRAIAAASRAPIRRVGAFVESPSARSRSSLLIVVVVVVDRRLSVNDKKTSRDSNISQQAYKKHVHINKQQTSHKDGYDHIQASNPTFGVKTCLHHQH